MRWNWRKLSEDGLLTDNTDEHRLNTPQNYLWKPEKSVRDIIWLTDYTDKHRYFFRKNLRISRSSVRDYSDFSPNPHYARNQSNPRKIRKTTP